MSSRRRLLRPRLRVGPLHRIDHHSGDEGGLRRRGCGRGGRRRRRGGRRDSCRRLDWGGGDVGQLHQAEHRGGERRGGCRQREQQIGVRRGGASSSRHSSCRNRSSGRDDSGSAYGSSSLPSSLDHASAASVVDGSPAPNAVVAAFRRAQVSCGSRVGDTAALRDQRGAFGSGECGCAVVTTGARRCSERRWVTSGMRAPPPDCGDGRDAGHRNAVAVERIVQRGKEIREAAGSGPRARPGWRALQFAARAARPLRRWPSPRRAAPWRRGTRRAATPASRPSRCRTGRSDATPSSDTTWLSSAWSI